MKHTSFNQFYLLALVGSAAIAAIMPQTVSAEENPWRIRFSVVSMDPSGTSVFVPETSEQISYTSSSATGVGIDLEYRASRRLGIDFGVLSASPQIDVEVDAQPFTANASGSLNTTPIYAALNIHLTPDSRFDLYVGPLLAYVRYDGFKLSVDSELAEVFSTENDLGIGAVVGLDIGLGSGDWLLSAAVRYIDTSLEATSSDGGLGKTDIDPAIYSLGVGYRF